MPERLSRNLATGIAGDRSGFTFLSAVFMVMVIGIMSAFTGKTWSMIKKREREKELIFRGMQIKEAIENWYNPKFSPVSVNGMPVRWKGNPNQLMNLEDLLKNPYLSNAGFDVRYLPQHYNTKLDEKNPFCAPDCAKIRLLEDPITGKEWLYLREGVLNAGQTSIATGTQGGKIVGVYSRSEEQPYRIDFRDMALENMGESVPVTPAGTTGATVTPPVLTNPDGSPAPAGGVKITKYSDIKFKADAKNDHAKIYRGYREGW